MNETSYNKEITYPFRFGTSNKLIHLNQRQLDCIPYLFNLVAHNYDCLSIQNENGEYVLSSRIRYSCFMPILGSITTGHTSVLFTELSEDANVLCMLQLYDYLCINPLSVPLLKGQHLVRLNYNGTTNEKMRIKYSRAKNLLEVRDMAVQFIVALSKNEYNLDDFNTLGSIYSLIMIILSNPDVFGTRICHHTWGVVKKHCFLCFSYKQQRQLHNAEESVQKIKTKSLMYLKDGNQPLSGDFQNAFAWKGEYVLLKEKDSADNSWKMCKWLTGFDNDTELTLNDDLDPDLALRYSIIFDIESRFLSLRYNFLNELRRYQQTIEELNRWLSLRSSTNESTLYQLLPGLRARAALMIDNPDDVESYIYQIKEEQKKNEAQSARSSRFNTLSKRPKIDKFKHRCGPKAQKHR